jgi:S-adenosylmethionine-diacylglycerol 3-amino-3-carboxypropyl transferase
VEHSKKRKLKKKKEQVQLFKLVFTHNWEDPESDHAALRIKSNDVVQAITSGGCNVLGFLLFDPKEIYSIDINPAQSYLLELKIAAIRILDFKDFIAFAGLTACNYRMELYSKLKPLLTENAASFWDKQTVIIGQGFIMNGKYERFIKLAGKFISLLQGRKKVQNLFGAKTKREQELYFDDVWNTKRFKYLFKILFNKRMLARRGLVADYFTFDDGSKSFADSFYNRSKKAFRDIPIQGNYFLSLYLLGKFSNINEVPAYLKADNFKTIKSRIDRIKIITGEAQQWIDTIPDQTIDCFALSNICELMSEQETHTLFTAIERTAKEGARIIFRNLMIPREVPENLQTSIKKEQSISSKLYENDRSFVYGKVAAYTVHKKIAAN